MKLAIYPFTKRIYQMGIAKLLDEIHQLFEILGYINDA